VRSRALVRRSYLRVECTCVVCRSAGLRSGWGWRRGTGRGAALRSSGGGGGGGARVTALVRGGRCGRRWRTQHHPHTRTCSSPLPSSASAVCMADASGACDAVAAAAAAEGVLAMAIVGRWQTHAASTFGCSCTTFPLPLRRAGSLHASHYNTSHHTNGSGPGRAARAVARGKGSGRTGAATRQAARNARVRRAPSGR
jgi:hypothetical protein